MLKKCKTFVFFREFEKEEIWDKALGELEEKGVGYIRCDPSVQSIVANPKVREKAVRFLDKAYGDYGIRAILSVDAVEGCYVDPKFAYRQGGMVAKGTGYLKDLEGVYAYYLEDEPVGGWDVSRATLGPWIPLFEEETGLRLPPQPKLARGRRLYEGWGFTVETARAFTLWRGRKYTEYTRKVIEAYKKVSPRIKATVCINLPGIFPSAFNPLDFEGLMAALDFIMIDIYPGWNWLPGEHDNTVDFVTRLVRGLTDKELWLILQGHMILLGYAPTVDEMKTWALEAIENGWDAVGWYAMEHRVARNLYNGTLYPHTPTKQGCPERWNAMMQLSKEIAQTERKIPAKSEVGVLASYDTILGFGKCGLLATHVALRRKAGVKTEFVSDNMVEENPDILSRYSTLFITPATLERPEVVQALRGFVEGGGTMVGAGQDLYYNMDGKETGKLRGEIFGIKDEKTFWREESIHLDKKVGRLERGYEMPGFWERRRLEPADTAEVLGRWSDGTAAITLNRLRKGNCICIGTEPYKAVIYRQANQWIGFIQALLA